MELHQARFILNKYSNKDFSKMTKKEMMLIINSIRVIAKDICYNNIPELLDTLKIKSIKREKLLYILKSNLFTYREVLI